MSLGSLNRLRFHYEHILRYDLLLKLNYKNIMQVPRICKINILAYGVPYNNVKNVSLALEIICGQKVFCTRLAAPMGQSAAKRVRSMGRSAKHVRCEATQTPTHWRRFSVSQSNSALLFCSLRTQTMYNFLEKLITILTASYDYKIQIKGQEVQITLSNREVRLFPEIQNHFEFFECFQSVQVTLVTSASNEKETRLLWTGLHQKEI